MQLCFAPSGRTLVLKEVLGGHEVRHRLAEMGIMVGTELELLQAAGSGPVMVRLGSSKIGIGRGMKIGKESIAGAIRAIERWMARDHAAIRAEERAARLAALRGRLAAIALEGDVVAPPDGVRRTLLPAGLPVETLVPAYAARHEAPFPREGEDPAAVQTAFDALFARAAEFLA